MPVWEWPQSRIMGIVDGDSFDALVEHVAIIDIGFGGHVEHRSRYTVRLRLNRINTPPGKTPEGQRASARVAELMPVGSTVYLQTIKPYKFGGPPTSPGEWMAEVTLTDGRNLSEILVAEGLAVYWNGEGPRPGGLRPGQIQHPDRRVSWPHEAP